LHAIVLIDVKVASSPARILTTEVIRAVRITADLVRVVDRVTTKTILVEVGTALALITVKETTRTFNNRTRLTVISDFRTKDITIPELILTAFKSKLESASEISESRISKRRLEQ
jgi:hypothetical protein